MNNDKQFTPEEIVQQFTTDIPGCSPYLTVTMAVAAIRKYAAQQTAALREELEECDNDSQEFQRLATERHGIILEKDKEIRQLKADREKHASQKVKDACHDRDEIMRQLFKNEMAAKDERIKEREAQCLDAERDYRKSFKDGLQKDARIAELEEHIALANVRTKVHINNELEKAARIAELEKLIIDISEDFKLKLSGYQTIEKQLHEKVKQLEKDALTWEHGCDKLIAERDQAFDLLEQAASILSEDPSRVGIVIMEISTLLSSRENKKT